MDKINENLDNQVSKIEQERGELAVVPIFRANDLYQAMFPEIQPLFQKGEQVGASAAKKVLDAILINENSAVILDDTCNRPLTRLKLEDLPERFGLKELPAESKGFLSRNSLKELLKTHYNIDYSPQVIIDDKIRSQFESKFSPEFARSLFEIAKRKNPNIKRVFILSNNIGDHAGWLTYSDAGDQLQSAREVEATITFEETTPQERKEHDAMVLVTLKKEVQKEIGVEPIIVPSIKQTDIQDGDLVVVDRHNPLISSEKINEVLPKQISLLPIETELHNNEKFMGEDFQSQGLANILRKNFEKSGF